MTKHNNTDTDTDTDTGAVAGVVGVVGRAEALYREALRAEAALRTATTHGAVTARQLRDLWEQTHQQLESMAADAQDHLSLDDPEAGPVIDNARAADAARISDYAWAAANTHDTYAAVAALHTHDADAAQPYAALAATTQQALDRRMTDLDQPGTFLDPITDAETAAAAAENLAAQLADAAATTADEDEDDEQSQPAASASLPDPAAGTAVPVAATSAATRDPDVFLACPECGEHVADASPTSWAPAWGSPPQWSHQDGEPLCPVMGPDGYQPAEPLIVPRIADHTAAAAIPARQDTDQHDTDTIGDTPAGGPTAAWVEGIPGDIAAPDSITQETPGPRLVQDVAAWPVANPDAAAGRDATAPRLRVWDHGDGRLTAILSDDALDDGYVTHKAIAQLHAEYPDATAIDVIQDTHFAGMGPADDHPADPAAAPAAGRHIYDRVTWVQGHQNPHITGWHEVNPTDLSAQIGTDLPGTSPRRGSTHTTSDHNTDNDSDNDAHSDSDSEWAQDRNDTADNSAGHDDPLDSYYDQMDEVAAAVGDDIHQVGSDEDLDGAW